MLQDFFSRHPVFTLEEVINFLQERASAEANIDTRKALLRYHQEQGHIVRIRRGLYASVQTGFDAKGFPVDPFLITSKLAIDAVLAYHTALDFWGLSYSVWHQFTYVTNHPRCRSVAFQNSTFRAVRQPPALSSTNNAMFDVKTEERQGLNVRVTSQERTLVDVLARPDLAGGWEEIWRSLELANYFDISKIVQYALLLQNATTIAKVGFFLQQHQEQFSVKDNQLAELKSFIPVKPHYGERSQGVQNKFLPEWNLIMPLQVVERSWEETYGF